MIIFCIEARWNLFCLCCTILILFYIEVIWNVYCLYCIILILFLLKLGGVYPGYVVQLLSIENKII